MNWFEKILPPKIKSGDGGNGKRGVPEGLWTKCPACSAVLYRAELERNLDVCPKCDNHLRISARSRLNHFLDDTEQREIGQDLRPIDALKFKDKRRYKDRLNDAQKATGHTDALIVTQGTLEQKPIIAAAFEFEFMGGSMGSVVGERFVRSVQLCMDQRIPLVCFCASGGARMQEALYPDPLHFRAHRSNYGRCVSQPGDAG